MYRGKYDADKRYICVHMGVFFAVDKPECSVRQVVDGSAFDFGVLPNGTLPTRVGGYPWCVLKPDRCYQDQSLVMKYDQPDSRECWDNFVKDFSSCSVVCKKKLH
ncbi:hypothetical protein AAVH_15189 [Aphelenchoides avenae]|nr:hypothetical protein AAVH_15189 [Aphelenchus avenae]